MKGRKILLATVPLLAMASIVGAGYSTWYFDTQRTTESPVTVTIDDYVNLGGQVAVKTAPKVNFDQLKEDKKGFDQEVTGGITWETPFEITYTWDSTTSYHDHEVEPTEENLQLSYYWTVSSDLSHYVSLSDGVNEETAIVADKESSSPAGTVTTITFSLNKDKEPDSAVDEMAYIADNKPTDFESYKNFFEAAYAGGALNLHFILEYVEA